MKIVFMRHGKAEAFAASDSQRPLAAQGIEEADAVAKGLTAKLQGISKVLVSPYLRAQQTYAAIEPHLPNVPKVDTPLLIPSSTPVALISHLYELEQNHGVESVLLVTHQPLVGDFVNAMCAGNTNAVEPSTLSIKTATMGCIKADPCALGFGELEWVEHAH